VAAAFSTLAAASAASAQGRASVCAFQLSMSLSESYTGLRRCPTISGSPVIRSGTQAAWQSKRHSAGFRDKKTASGASCTEYRAGKARPWHQPSGHRRRPCSRVVENKHSTRDRTCPHDLPSATGTRRFGLPELNVGLVLVLSDPPALAASAAALSSAAAAAAAARFSATVGFLSDAGAAGAAAAAAAAVSAAAAFFSAALGFFLAVTAALAAAAFG